MTVSQASLVFGGLDDVGVAARCPVACPAVGGFQMIPHRTGLRRELGAEGRRVKCGSSLVMGP